MKIALFGTDLAQSYGENIEHLINGLASSGVSFCYYDKLYSILSNVAEQRGFKLPEGAVFSSYDDLGEDPDLFLALGGDGTFLHSLSVVRDRDVKVAGINFGRLGFLTTAKVSSGENDWISLLLEGKYDVISRTTLEIESDSLPEGFFPIALNEISIQRRTPYMIGIDLKIDGIDIPTYWADGLLIATPTGSTAYSLSVGGPIVTPEAGVFVIAPIAPHNLNVRPLIVPQSSTVEISFQGRHPQALLTVDNRSLNIEAGEKIAISRGEFPIKSISINNNFIAALNQKLLWGEDKRNMQ